MSYMPVIIDLDKKIKHCKERQFTGVMSIEADATVPWLLYFLAGQVVWANTRTHAKRRWQRHILKHCPTLTKQSSDLDLTYNVLAKLVMRKQFSREQFSALVAGCISEVLFDILQQGTLYFQTSRKLLTYRASPRDAAKFSCIGLQYIPIWEQVQQDWQAWEQSQLISILPNQAPVIEQPENLRERTSITMFRALTGLVDGQQTLRDLALRVKQPLLSLTLSLVPHIRTDFIRMVEIDDLNTDTLPIGSSSLTYQTAAIQPQKVVTPSASLMTSTLKTASNVSTILYIDDSPTDSQVMGQIVQTAGYRYMNIADPLQALPQLLEIKPKLIFLDLVMPVANGYELCAQIRRVSALRDIPIVIVTNNDGIADRVRAKVVGASGFMGKPIKQQRVLKVLKKYMQDSDSIANTIPPGSNLSLSV
ncbi:response regulator [Leptolyngbya cf. ectocarpi LEGE 11479]|uniref:Response regulator n=1 Tax=Leptolyngbya cf. ectocarpi LEGE 11479 TaxID=1828722 RepID=A0A928WYT5_LEPEC|nr:response regulator [Leptolyngbya ectocarpi]MBE9065812.1 response regulator [Leptolyngbya cf. ectocarpi LEGE 11479]